MRSQRVTGLKPGDRVCLGDIEHGRRMSSDWSTDGLVVWCSVVDPSATPPPHWGTDEPRLMVDGGCGGGDWLPEDGCVLLSYRPSECGGILADREADFVEGAALIIRECRT